MEYIIAVYGTLKKGYYNHLLIRESGTYLGTYTVKGAMQMIGLSYPMLFEKGDKEYECEVYRIPAEVFQLVESMEHGAGYYTKILKTQEYGDIHIYFGEEGRFSEDKPIIDIFNDETINNLAESQV